MGLQLNSFTSKIRSPAYLGRSVHIYLAISLILHVGLIAYYLSTQPTEKSNSRQISVQIKMPPQPSAAPNSEPIIEPVIVPLEPAATEPVVESGEETELPVIAQELAVIEDPEMPNFTPNFKQEMLSSFRATMTKERTKRIATLADYGCTPQQRQSSIRVCNEQENTDWNKFDSVIPSHLLERMLSKIKIRDEFYHDMARIEEMIVLEEALREKLKANNLSADTFKDQHRELASEIALITKKYEEFNVVKFVVASIKVGKKLVD